MDEAVCSLGVPEVRELRQMREENARLKRLVADLTLDKQIIQEVIRKRLKPARGRELAQWVQDRYQVSCRRACALASIPSKYLVLQITSARCGGSADADS